MNAYDLKQSIPNKVVQDDGTVTDIFGKAVASQEIGYRSRRSLPNKWLQPDDTYVTLQEIIAGAIDTELFIIVEELPETGQTNKIYLVPNDETGGFVEYIYVDNRWDPIGMISIDLSNYWTIEQVQQAITVALNQAKAYADELFANTAVSCNLGMFTDYTSEKPLDLNKLTPGVYLLYRTSINNRLYLKGTIDNTDFTGYFQILDDHVRGPFTLLVTKKVEDITTSSPYLGNFFYVEVVEGSNASIRHHLQSIQFDFNGHLINTNTGSLSQLEVVIRGTTQTITGEKTFSTLPKSTVVPSDNAHLVNKKYVDDAISSSVTDALGGEY